MEPDMPCVLFHGTGIYCLASIVASNELEEGWHWGKPGEPHGPRFSADFEIAKSFIEYNLNCEEGGVIVIDTSALIEDFKLVAYSDTWLDGGLVPNEQEWVALTPAITDVNRYLLSVVCDPAIINQARDPALMGMAMNEGGWPFAEGQAGIDACLDALDALASCSMLNVWQPEGSDQAVRTKQYEMG